MIARCSKYVVAVPLEEAKRHRLGALGRGPGSLNLKSPILEANSGDEAKKLALVGQSSEQRYQRR